MAGRASLDVSRRCSVRTGGAAPATRATDGSGSLRSVGQLVPVVVTERRRSRCFRVHRRAPPVTAGCSATDNPCRVPGPSPCRRIG